MSWKIKENIFLSIVIIFFLLIGIKVSADLPGWCSYPYYSYYTNPHPTGDDCWTYSQCAHPCRTKYQCGPAGNLLDLRKYEDLTRADFESWGCWERYVPLEAEGISCRQCKSDVPTADCHEKICMVPDSEETAICDQSVVDCVSIPTMTHTNPANFDNENEIPHQDERPVATERLLELGLPNYSDSYPAYTSYWQNEQERLNHLWSWPGGNAYRCDTAKDCCYNGFPYTMLYYPKSLPVEGIKYRVDNEITAPLWYTVPPDIDSWEEFDQFISKYGKRCYYFGGNKREDRCISAFLLTGQDFFFLTAYPKPEIETVYCPSSFVDPDPYYVVSRYILENCPDLPIPAGARIITSSKQIPKSNGQYIVFKVIGAHYWVRHNKDGDIVCIPQDPPFTAGIGRYSKPPIKDQAYITYHYSINVDLPGGGTAGFSTGEVHDNLFIVHQITSPSGAHTGYGYSDNSECETENVTFCIEGAQANLFDKKVLDNNIRKCRDYYKPD